MWACRGNIYFFGGGFDVPLCNKIILGRMGGFQSPTTEQAVGTVSEQLALHFFFDCSILVSFVTILHTDICAELGSRDAHAVQDWRRVGANTVTAGLRPVLCGGQFKHEVQMCPLISAGPKCIDMPHPPLAFSVCWAPRMSAFALPVSPLPLLYYPVSF